MIGERRVVSKAAVVLVAEELGNEEVKSFVAWVLSSLRKDREASLVESTR